MHFFKQATRRRGRIPCFWLLPVLFSLVSLPSGAAFSASLTVKVRQVNPDSGIHQVTCAERTKCLLPIDIQTGSTKETLTVHVLFASGNVMFEFETPKGFFYAGEKTPADKQNAIYRTLWHEAKPHNIPSTNNVTLFLPFVPHAEVAPMLNVVQQPVADLEIATEAAP